MNKNLFRMMYSALEIKIKILDIQSPRMRQIPKAISNNS